jgi:hypothetical protein
MAVNESAPRKSTGRPGSAGSRAAVLGAQRRHRVHREPRDRRRGGWGAAGVKVLVAAVAAWSPGALSMAAGEYVSVSSQADTERAELERERIELRDEPDDEEDELAAIYVGRGLEPALARTVGATADGTQRARGARARRARPAADFAARPLQARAGVRGARSPSAPACLCSRSRSRPRQECP